jgi:signal peptidase I
MILNLIRLARQGVGVVGIALFVVVIGFSAFIHIAPMTGRELFVVVGGSMEPSIPVGSLVVATQKDVVTITVGDVVAIRSDSGVMVTHRVSRVVDLPEGRSFETKGDANKSPDAGLVPARAIVGAVGQYIPYAGFGRDFLSTPSGIVAALALIGALILTHLLLEMLERAARTTPAEARGPVTS